MSAVGVSIITPAYNAEHCIADAVESALAQEVSVPFEMVVVDDGSSDATLRSWTSSPRVIRACCASIAIRRTAAAERRATLRRCSRARR